jgi:hypothetical protein
MELLSRGAQPENSHIAKHVATRECFVVEFFDTTFIQGNIRIFKLLGVYLTFPALYLLPLPHLWPGHRVATGGGNSSSV